MKTLVLVRHAKSSWDSPLQNDFERPLNDRGKKDAPDMAERLKKKRKLKIDAFVSSPAKRAKKTAEFFVKEFDQDEDEIIFKTELYHASPEVFYQVIEALPDKYETVALFSHNPGITEFVNTLSCLQIDNMPTCGIFAVKLDSDKWADISGVSKDFLFFDYPKAEK